MRRATFGVLVAGMTASIAYAAFQLVAGTAVNISSSAAASEKGRLVRLAYSENDAFLQPYVVVYTDGGGTPAGQLNVYAQRSFDDGATWEPAILLSRDAGGNPTGGQTVNVAGSDFAADNDKATVFAPQSYAANANRSLLVSWTSSYCPEHASGAYPNGNQKINTALTPNRPFHCLWTARSIDAGATWTTEQLSDGSRDAINDVLAGSQSNNAFAIAWQEDPLGLQPGEAEGPGDGGSGAHTTAGTNIWYSWASTLTGANPLFGAHIVQLSDNTASPNPGDGPPIGPGASRPTLQMSGSTAAIVYEESKGGVGLGKNVIYHSFRYNTPDTSNAGLIVSDPNRNSRRARLVLQGDSAAGTSPLRALVFYRQAVDTTPGAPSDIIVHRGLKDIADPASTGFRPEDLEHDSAGFLVSQNLSDTGAQDNALAHRAIIRGEFVALGYSHTPDMVGADPERTNPPTQTHNFFVRTSADSGSTWGAPHNVTRFSAVSWFGQPTLSVSEPRLVPTPGTIVNPLTGVPEPGDTQDSNVLFVSFGSYLNTPDKPDYRVYVTRSTNLGASYEPFTTVPGDPGQSESQLRPRPDGTAAVILWMQEMAPTAARDVMLATVTATDMPDPPTVAPSGGGGCFIATAAWGTPMQEEVRYLRAFRDQYLLTNEPGRAFVAMYYQYSPPVADFIREHDTLRAVVRTGLAPLVALSRQLVSAPAEAAGR